MYSSATHPSTCQSAHMLRTSIHTPIQPYMLITYTPEFILSTGESTHLSELSVIGRWINPRHSIFITEVECEWMGGMNEHVVCACGISTTEWITGESTRCAPLFLVSIPCHLSLSLSPLSLSWYRTVYNLGRLQCACLRHKYRHLLPTTPLHSMRHGLIHSHSSRESLSITRSTNIFKLLYGYPRCSFIFNRIFSIPFSFSTCTCIACNAKPSGSKWPHGNQLWHCL